MTNFTFVNKSFFIISVLIIVFASGCSEDSVTVTDTQATVEAPVTTATTPASTVPEGISLDPNLRSSTGTPSPEEMVALIDLQKKVPYPVIVPTYLPSSGYKLESDLIGFSSKTASDPTGYYSFKYTDPASSTRVMTFNQSQANNKQYSGYYLTDYEANGIAYHVYWHKTREYLPQGDPVRTDSVGDAETFIVVWEGQFTGADGQAHNLYYSISTGSYTGHGWGEMRAVLDSLRPLSNVAG